MTQIDDRICWKISFSAFPSSIIVLLLCLQSFNERAQHGSWENKIFLAAVCWLAGYWPGFRFPKLFTLASDKLQSATALLSLLVRNGMGSSGPFCHSYEWWNSFHICRPAKVLSPLINTNICKCLWRNAGSCKIIM